MPNITHSHIGMQVLIKNVSFKLIQLITDLFKLVSRLTANITFYEKIQYFEEKKMIS